MKKLFLILCIWVGSINAMDQELQSSSQNGPKQVIEISSSQDNTSVQSAQILPNNQELKDAEPNDLTSFIIALCAALYE